MVKALKPGQRGFVRQLARKVARRRGRRKVADPMAYAATVERRRLGNPIVKHLDGSVSYYSERQAQQVAADYRARGWGASVEHHHGAFVVRVVKPIKHKRPNPALAIFGNPKRRHKARPLRSISKDKLRELSKTSAERRREAARRRNGVPIAANARLVEYTDPRKGPDVWYHSFDSTGVRITGEPDGSVRLSHPRKRLWEPDGKGRNWLENPGAARGGTVAKRKKHRRGHRAKARARRPNRRRQSMKLRRNDPGRRVRHRRRNPGAGGFVKQLVPAAVRGLGITAGKVASRGLLPLVGFRPTGLVGLGAQTLAGVVVSGVVYIFARNFGLDMLAGSFATLYESLARTGIGGKPIPIVGTALSDYGEAWRLAGYQRPVGAYQLPISRGGARVRTMGRRPDGGRLILAS